MIHYQQLSLIQLGKLERWVDVGKTVRISDKLIIHKNIKVHSKPE